MLFTDVAISAHTDEGNAFVQFQINFEQIFDLHKIQRKKYMTEIFDIQKNTISHRNLKSMSCKSYFRLLTIYTGGFKFFFFWKLFKTRHLILGLGWKTGFRANEFRADDHFPPEHYNINFWLWNWNWNQIKCNKFNFMELIS